MRKGNLAILTLVVCVVTTNCATKQSASTLAPRLQHQGFSSPRPPNNSWFMKKSEQNPTTLLFRREVPGKTHTFFYAIQLSQLEREPSSNEDFTELVHQLMVAVDDPGRHEVLSYVSRPSPRQGQFCVRYTLRVIDRKSPVFPGRELRMNLEGLACRHPLWPNVLLDAFYSERGMPEELEPALGIEGEQLLKGLIIEVKPGVPAT
jgi:hypothetical protein